MNKVDAIREVLGVSSGTLGSLTGISRYDDLDQIEAGWVQWVAQNPHKIRRCKTWLDLWKEYMRDSTDTTTQAAMVS